ncbi:hypothetical protein [Deinococcus hohokamensis]|uniref:Uncharacterized protein n=1 Tax=Deinococcus hohokamensis TaxID=309883 RepID=A0ABV9IEK4_9DEIO
MGKSAELQRLDETRRALETALSSLTSDDKFPSPRTFDGAFETYLLEAARYRLSGTDRVAELHRQLAGAAPSELRTPWFTELDHTELLQVHPALVEASLSWMFGGTDDLMEVTVELPDLLPPDQAKTIFVDAFTGHLRRCTRNDAFTQEDAQRRGRSVDEIFYGTRTVQENAEALEAVVLNELDVYSVRVFRGILASARIDWGG